MTRLLTRLFRRRAKAMFLGEFLQDGGWTPVGLNMWSHPRYGIRVPAEAVYLRCRAVRHPIRAVLIAGIGGIVLGFYLGWWLL